MNVYWEGDCASPLTLFCQQNWYTISGEGMPYFSNGGRSCFKISLVVSLYLYKAKYDKKSIFIKITHTLFCHLTADQLFFLFHFQIFEDIINHIMLQICIKFQLRLKASQFFMETISKICTIKLSKSCHALKIVIWFVLKLRISPTYTRKQIKEETADEVDLITCIVSRCKKRRRDALI